MKVVATNKKARFEYFLESTFQAGIVLEGSEVKSIRNNGLSLSQSFVFVEGNELLLKNCYIKPYLCTASFVPDSRRTRKLLLNRREIDKIISSSREKGYTIIPVKVYFQNGLVKVEIALAKGKKLYDKKEKNSVQG